LFYGIIKGTGNAGVDGGEVPKRKKIKKNFKISLKHLMPAAKRSSCTWESADIATLL
jgi:hypothetical protein